MIFTIMGNLVHKIPGKHLKHGKLLLMVIGLLIICGSSSMADTKSSGLAYLDAGYSPQDVAVGQVINGVWVWKMKDGKVIANTNNISDVETIVSFKTVDYDTINLANMKTSVKKDGTVSGFIPSTTEVTGETKNLNTL